MLLFYFISLLILGLYPFEFKSICLSNQIYWLEDKNGIWISPCYEVASEKPPTEIFQSFVDAKGFTIEVYITIDDIDQNGPARIVTYSLNTSQRNFTLGQEFDSLILRLRTTESDENGVYPHFRGDNVFTPGKKQHVTVSYDGKLEKLYVDGQLRKVSSELEGSFSSWDPNAFFVIGNEHTGDRLWQGKIYLVALYNRALGDEEIYQNYKNIISSNTTEIGPRQNHNGLIRYYTFSEGKGDVVYNQAKQETSGHLIPVNLHLNSLKSFNFLISSEDIITYFRDIAVNIIGFIPLSFILFFNASKHRSVFSNIYFRPILVGLIISISLEFLQVFSITRVPTILDVLCNLIGTVIGSISLHIGWMLLGRKHLLNG
jgi:VanZ family protein